MSQVGNDGLVAGPRIRLFSHSPAVLLWPIPVFAVILAKLTGWGFTGDGTAGWVFFAVVATVLVALVTELNRNKLLVLLITLGLIVAAIGWFGAGYEVPVFKHIYTWIGELDVKFDSGFAQALSFLTAVMWLADFFVSRISGRWILNPNTIEHINFGRVDDNLPRIGRRFVLDLKDLLESFLTFGGGTMRIIGLDGKPEREVERVPFLYFHLKRIDTVIETTRVFEGGDAGKISPTAPAAK